MAKTLEEILNVSAAAGPFSTGDAVLEQTLRDFIQLQSTTIAVGTKVVGSRTVPWLDFKWYTGVNGTFSYPLDDNAVVDPTKVGTANYGVKLEKGQGRVTFLDSVRLRGESWENIDRQQLGIVRARADKIDNHILSTLIAGAGQTQAATATFGAAAADEEKDLLDAMDLIFANAKVGRVANLTIYYSRDYGASGALGNDALLLIPGAETAEFFQYNGPGFQETELTRIPGVGFDWLLTSFMGSVVHEMQDGAAAGKNNRIVKITGVRA